MRSNNQRIWHTILILCLVLVLSACGGTAPPPDDTPVPTSTATATLTPTPSPEPQQPATATFTPTPTSTPQATAAATSTAVLPSEPQEPATPTSAIGPTSTPTLTPPASRCQGLSGQLEVQVLVGPAEAVGLEPVAVGTVPWAVTTSSPPYLVEGQGPISYDATLSQEWGTYAVTMDMQTTVQGECSDAGGSGQLDLVLEMTGDQLVVVDAEGFHGEYPWSGTQSLDLTFPVEEGATARGEGWVIVLHLDTP